MNRLSIRSAVGLCVGASIAVAAIHAGLGVGYVLDDWYTLGNAHFDGILSTAGREQNLARPGAAATYMFVFGVLGGHPLASFAVQAVIGAVTAGLLLVLLVRLISLGMALTVTLVWVVMPNHMSLEVWASATNIAISLMALVAGGLALTSTRQGHMVLSAISFSVAILCYEAVLPAVGVMVVALPWIRLGRPDPRAIGLNAAVQGATFGWMVWHWHPQKSAQKLTIPLDLVLHGHFGWGVLPEGLGDAGLALALIGVLAATWTAVRERRADQQTWMIAAGLVIIGAGVLPFVRYFYAPVGAGDRVTVVSAVGGALVWAGLLGLLWRVRRGLFVGSAFGLMVLAMVARWDFSGNWADASADGLAIRRGVVESIPTPPPDRDIVVGPAPVVVRNVTPFLDRSNIEPALQLAYGDRGVRARMSFGEDDFLAVDEDVRFDLTDVVRPR